MSTASITVCRLTVLYYEQQNLGVHILCVYLTPLKQPNSAVVDPVGTTGLRKNVHSMTGWKVIPVRCWVLHQKPPYDCYGYRQFPDKLVSCVQPLANYS